MDKVEGRRSRWAAAGFLWSIPLTQRLLVLAGLVLIGFGYSLILNSSDIPNAADVQAVSRNALGGMALVICGGVVEVLLLLDHMRH